MKYIINTYDEFLFESTTDGTVEAFIEVAEFATKAGIFDKFLFDEVKSNFIDGVHGSLNAEIFKLPADKKKQFLLYVDQLMKPLEVTTNFREFIKTLKIISDTKNNIIKRLMLTESINFKSSFLHIKDAMKKAGSNITEWWDRNKYEILKTIIEFLVQLMIELLFAILKALLKTDKIETPKFKFSGGKFGGGGAGTKW